MESDIIELARAAGLTLSQTETTLLRALVEKGSFDGSKYCEKDRGADVTGDIRAWLPSVWRMEDLYGEITKTNNTDFQSIFYRDHDERLYAKAPFPIISGTLLRWLLCTEEAVNQLPYVDLANIKIAGDCCVAKCQVNFGISFTECVFENRFSLSGHIGGQLSLTGVYAHYIELSGEYPANIVLNDVQCRGMDGRGPGGSLFLNALSSPRLFIYGLFVPGRVVIRNSKITEVEITGRVLGNLIRVDRCELQSLNASRGEIEQPFDPIFNLRSVTIAHDCSLENFPYVSVAGAVIKGNLSITGLLPGGAGFSVYSYLKGGELQLSDVEVNGTLCVGVSPEARKQQLEERDVRLIFDHVRVHRYEDSREDLTAIKQLKIDGLEYQELIKWGAKDLEDRIQWLTLQPKEPFPLASWRRLATQMQRHGRFREARHLLIESERRRRESLHPGASARFWSLLLRVSTGYGWNQWRIGLFAVLLVTLGSVIAWTGMERGLFAQTTNISAGVAFSPVVYSLDSALPIIKLGHASLWIPTGRGWDGQLVQVYFWVHIAMGWIMGTLFVISFTDVAHKSDAK